MNVTKKLVSETLKMPTSKIDSSEPLEKYGIDSILVVQLTNTMRRVFENISSTLFFEVQTINGLVDHLMKSQKEALIRQVGLEEQTVLSEEKSVAEGSPSSVLSRRSRTRRSRRFFPVFGSEKERPSSQICQVQDVAIIGLSGRYPGAENVNEFWENLKTGRNCICEIPEDRWDWREFFDDEKGKSGKIYSKWGGFLKEVDKFDPLFFQISPREAEQMDPQERLFLEETYKSIEDSGYTAETLCESRKIGVFVGVMNGSYTHQSSYWSIANRVSYLLNFQGPSMAVDTACSSSLTAIHLALESLYSGMSDCAIAGGVSLILRPIQYLGLSSMTMLSPTDECKSFGDHADGFVDGEGVGALVLKLLKKAIADNDHIYGVLKGSVVNAGGKTNGFTVPNPNAQCQLISEALKRSGIKARAVSYIEAHGTGTKLGDPIEITGLSKAFGADVGKQYCRIGSAKSNIGHCESAAGIAGVTKVLLQMQHSQIVPSLHSQVLNPHIDFTSTPFVVNQKLRDWDRPIIAGRAVPRIAGISSFGAGGSNAHIIIEEWPLSAEGTDSRDEGRGERDVEIKDTGPYLIMLSAKNEDRLKEVVKNLYTYLTSPHAPRPLPLHEVAYTLQVGREAMEERLAVMVKSLEELEEKLKGFLENQDVIDNLYRGQAKRNKDTLAVFTADEDLQQAMESWIAKGKYDKLLDLWVKGLTVDWNKLYGDSKPRRISLPTYPFAKERYWIPKSTNLPVNLQSKIYSRAERDGPHPLGEQRSVNLKSTRLHPLLHENTSNFEEQKFSSTFTGDEFFLKDHQLNGQKVLPGVAYLEMAREAVKQASGALSKESQGIRLKSVVWARSIAVNDPKEVHIGLFPEESGEIGYEIYTTHLLDGKSDIATAAQNSKLEIDSKDATVVHSQGVVTMVAAEKIPLLKFTDFPAKLQQRSLSSQACYKAFKRMGIDYGPAHQGLEKIYVGDNEVLAKLTLPACVSGTKDQFILHPSLLDSALQASIGLYLRSKTDVSYSAFSLQPPVSPLLPFTLERLEVIDHCSESMWAWIRYADTRASGGTVQKIDIDLCDKDGTICIQMKALSFQTVSPASIFQHPLQPLPGRGSNYSEIIEKPNTISLRSLSEDQILSSKPESQSQASITLSSTNISPSQSVISESLKSVVHVQSFISEDTLQKELATSFAETLYMKQTDVDMDKQFVDMGLDSIIGVEWIGAVNKKYGTSIQATKIYDYPTLRELAGFLAKEMREHGGINQKLLKSTPSLPVLESSPELRSRISPQKQYDSMQSFTRFSDPKIAPSRGVGTRRRNNSSESSNGNEFIAIVGMSGRYPGASNLDQYWKNLAQAKNSIREIPPSRWNVNAYYDPRPSQQGKIYCKWLGLLEDEDCFDPLFFNISPVEAEEMDPQHRLFLQEAYKAFEDSGYSRQSLSNKRCGVYLGIMSNEYSLLLFGNRTGTGNTTGNSYAIGAARIAYYLNLKGPAIPIDTACSSSLVATHLAGQALLDHEIDMALVGGVTLYLTPESYVGMCAAGMLSPDGRCKTFDNRADGFVPGEGVGCLVLKRLRDAEADHDTIHGVILGSGINQDGKTNGITAPSVTSQMELERAVYDKYKIDPESIQYVEMHGTGTQLGDPIELEALSTVFKERTDRKNFCAIGSVKSNIGHTSAAAGIASIQKVLLSLKYKKLVPTLNFNKPNEHFDFKNSPFYVNTELKPWETDAEIPRRASVSSFGFSGTNAHVVIEEYLNKKSEIRNPKSETTSNHLIVLSAKNENRLKEVAKNLYAYLTSPLAPRPLLHHEVAYTLQVGREAMEERLAVIVRSTKELEEKLKGFLEGSDEIENLYHGQVRRNKDTLAVFAADEELQEAIEKWIQREKYAKLLDLWVKGLVFDWTKLYGDVKPRRISLPTYPFAKERYWIAEPSITDHRPPTTDHPSSRLHPLVHINTSNLSVQRFNSTFRGKEFFLKDHQVNGQKVLPGVAYLEMAREAVKHATDGYSNESQCLHLKNVVWARPLVVDDAAQQVHVGLFPEESGEIAYEIYTGNSNAEEGVLVHSQGVARFVPSEKMASLPLSDLQEKLNQKSLNPKECYEAFKKMGIEYGPAHQGLAEVYVGNNEVLAKLTLPGCVSDTKDQFILHPSLLDSALQAAIGLYLRLETDASPSAYSLQPTTSPFLPFALDRLEIIDRCPEVMWAWVRIAKNFAPNDSREVTTVQKLDIDLCDEDGNVCVKLQGFSSRVLDGEISKKAEAVGTVVVKPVWKETPNGAHRLDPEQTLWEYTDHRVFLCGLNGMSRQASHGLQDKVSQISFIDLKSSAKTLDKHFEDSSIKLFETIQKILQEKPKGNVLLQVLVPCNGSQQVFSALSGLLKTARLENPKILGQVIAVEKEESLENILPRVQESSQFPEDQQIRYEGEKRLVASFEEVASFGGGGKDIPWKHGGVYLITGGAGGLGLIFAKEIAEKVKCATLILTGRSELNKEKEAKLKELEILGAKVEYQPVDICDKGAVEVLVQEIQINFGGLNGIIHSAGVVRDNFILKKSKEEFKNVLAPKVLGAINLDETTKALEVDFFVLFSSGAGMTGNLGQADYSTANAFMDALAKFRHFLLDKRERRGQTLSINWPLWREGGMGVDEATEKMLKESTGMVPMETSSGIEAFYQGLASNMPQVMVMEGLLKRLRQNLLPSIGKVSKAKAVPASAEATSQIDTGHFFDRIQQMLTQIVSKLLKVKSEDLDADAELSEYGFDSITLTDFANRLNQTYQLELTPTVFFEYPTLGSLAKYLTEEHQDVFAEQFRTSTQRQSVIKTEGVEFEEDIEKPQHRSRFARTVMLPKSDFRVSSPIAVVGISGCFPMANDVDEFWQNLVEGKDCITEIPETRWDWQAHYGDPQTETNKTNIKWGGFIDGVDEFDPLFFGISPREAKLMDPQQRLLMTYVWKAIEDAGYSASSLSGSNTGIFIGTASSGYNNLVAAGNVAIEGFSSTGMVPSVGPNRMSYFFNAHGPSEPIETACSSSLVAVHRAVIAMKTGGCDQAIVGGVNTMVTPDAHISFNKAGMLCKDGRCKTFSSQANGYVRGEGVGMLFLKKLKEAEKAEDHVYGVIRATAENHGGRANSLTAPNPKAQAELFKTAYTQAGIDPRTVSYIEAHGTGTELGDPIEINGLKTAFTELYHSTGDSELVRSLCGLGSVKTNIGHLELAAGIAGVIKVLLQLKHRTLVKSLHCEEINPYIRLERSPFYIVHEKQEWKALRDEQGNDLPRRAGVSSFGFGGVNAHVVIEEWPSPTEGADRRDVGRVARENDKQPALIVLSAKNENRLKEVAENLYTYITSPLAPRPLSLHEVAYTLQVGREAMQERLGLIVRSMEELEEKLGAFIDEKEDVEELYRGQVKRNKDTLAVFAADEDMQETIDKWISKGKYNKLLDLWVKGLIIDWNKLYGKQKPRRISLPTYPFAKERYWIEEKEAKGEGQRAKGYLHPLVHENTSNFEEQKFSSIFTGQEFFLKDHQVQGQKVLPGVAYLEMAREALKQAAGGFSNGSQRLHLKNVVWSRPIAVGVDPQEVKIGLFPEENGEIAYEIYTTHPADGKSEIRNQKLETQLRDEIVVHSEGVATFAPSEKMRSLNLTNLQAGLNDHRLNPEACYAAFKTMGIDYGPAHQGLEKIYVGDNEVLAKLTLPACVSGAKDQFILYPGLLDSTLQAAIGLYLKSKTEASFSAYSLQPTASPLLPFALDRLEVIGRCPESVWAWVRYADGIAPGNKIQKLDIDLCDEDGKVCVKMQGFSTRILEGELIPGKGLKSYDGPGAGEHNFSRANVVLNKGGKSETQYVGSSLKGSQEVPVGLITMSPVWNAISIEKMEVHPEKNAQMIIYGRTQEELKEFKKLFPKAKALTIEPHATIDAIARQLKEQGDIEHLVWIAPNKNVSLTSLGTSDIIQEQTQGVLQVFRIIKALLSLGYAERDLAWTLITEQTQAVRIDDQVNPTHASVHGLIGSLAKEYQNWKIRLLDMDDSPWPIQEMFSLPYNPLGNARAYRNGDWFFQELLPVRKLASQGNLYKTGGVYVVIGGAGGIGEVWSRWMLQNYQAQIIWVGRRKIDTAIQQQLDMLSTFGPVPTYVQADAANPESLKEAYAQIKKKHAQINGVIHSAIVLLDSSLATMDEDRFKSGLRAKVDVSVVLAQVFEKERLDFVMFFSSMIAFGKAAGQSNYAAGCTFKDAFARRLAQDWSCVVKVMNWGYWGSVGIVADPSYQDRMERAGIGSIEPEEGMEALETLLNGPLDQLALLKTSRGDVLGNPGEMSFNEWINSYPQTIPSKSLQSLKETLSNQEGKWDQTLSAGGLQDPEMEAFLYKFLLASMHGFLKSQNGLLDRYHRWLQESFSVLLAGNYLKKQDDGSYALVGSAPDLEELWGQWDEKKVLWSQDVNKKAQFVLMDACLRALPEILTGKQQATDVMFPNSTMELVEGIYKGNAVSDLFNGIFGEALVAYIEERLDQDSSSQIRILEIGAGTGGTTAGLLAKLRPFQDHIGEYCYSDISKAFLMHAQENYAPQTPFLSTQIFNVENPISGQGIKANSYDIVIAANVLHATQSIRQTLRNAKAPLRKGGLLLLNELSDKSLFAHMTFGLLEGWWLYEDPQLRIPGCPGLYPKTWARVLNEEGFVSTFFPAEKIHPLGQQIVVAQSDGIVRQKQVASKVPLVKQEIKANVLTKHTPERKPPKANKESISQDLFREKSTIYLKKLVSETLKMPTSKIDSSEPLEKYGIDSILVVQLTNTVRKVFENISSALFFEVQTIDGLVDHLIKTQKDALIRQVGPEEPIILSDEKSGVEGSLSAALSRPKARRSNRFFPVFRSEIEKSSFQICQVQDVAIIGLSGRYPEAENVNEFWENLKTGKNCIREIPKDRWDWREFFDDEKGKSGKIYSKWGGFLKEVDKFDPLFFKISPREAEQMDPQERLFIEEAYNSHFRFQITVFFCS